MRASGTPPYWSPGEVVLWRFYRPDLNPSWVVPARVVRDDAELFACWVASGTTLRKPALPDGRPVRDAPLEQRFRLGRTRITDIWHGPGSLRLAPTGMPWSAWIFRRPSGEFHCWYVNLEEPHRRDADGILTRDRQLDLVVTPDRTVQYKDEDELAATVDAGLHTAAEAAQYYRDAAVAAELAAAGAPPFTQDWLDWRADPQWTVPNLDDWDVDTGLDQDLASYRPVGMEER